MTEGLMGMMSERPLGPGGDDIQNCGNCHHWEQMDGMDDQGICIVISEGQQPEVAQVIGHGPEGSADFLCANMFYCSLYEPEEMDDVSEIGGSEPEGFASPGIGMEPGTGGRWQP